MVVRIAVGGFGHETNSFVSHRADFDYFADHRDRPPHVRGDEVLSWLRDGSFPMSGFIAEMEREYTLVPLVWAHGSAGGVVTEDAFERIAGELVGRLSEALPVDAIYLDLHGAMVAERFEDAEGELLRRCRAVVGDVPICASLDYHANVTPMMVEFADSMVIFRTYPHVDRPQTGQRAGRIVRELIAGGLPGGRSLRKLPFLIPATSQCTLVEPSRSITSRAAAFGGEVLALEYAAGFPPSDLYWCGPSVVAYARTQELADRAADGLSAWIEDHEADFASRLLPAAEAVREAGRIARDASCPVVIADAQDNPGGGGSGDTTGLLEALLDAHIEDAVVGIFCDAEAAHAAHRAGEGVDIELRLGGRFGPAGVKPLFGTFNVRKLGTGRFRTTGAVAGGQDTDLGPMALLRIGGVDIVVSSKRMQAFDRAPFEHLGVQLDRYRFIIVKSAVHFRAEFAPMAEAVILAAAPGGFLDDARGFPFQRLRAGVRLMPCGPTHPGSD